MKIKATTALLASLLFSSGAFADAVKTDWIELGDKLAFVDTDTGIEWLKLSETKGQSVTSVSHSYPGWRLPTETEINAMFYNIFDIVDPIGSDSVFVTDEKKAYWLDLFGLTSGGRSSGFYLKDNNYLFQAGASGANSIYTDYTNNTYEQYKTNGVSFVGVFLVSDGGETLTSKNNPSINSANDVPVGFGFLSAFLLPLLFRKTQNQQN